MDSRETIILKKRRTFIRSLSSQPESHNVSNSAYLSNKRSKSPGRRLTEVYIRQPVDGLFNRSMINESNLSKQFFYGSNSSMSSQLHNSFASESSSQTSLNRHISTYKTNCYSFDRCKENEDKESIPAEVRSKRSSFRDAFMQSSFSNFIMFSAAIMQMLSKVQRPISNICFILLRYLCTFIFWITCISLMIVMLILAVLAIKQYQEQVCLVKKISFMPFNILSEEISKSVIGQDIAKEVIIDSWKNHEARGIIYPLILWFVGWTGNGKSLVTRIIKEVYPHPEQVQMVVPSLIPLGKVPEVALDLVYNLDSCSSNVIVIDGWNFENDSSIWILKTFIRELKAANNKGLYFGQIYLFIIGTVGSIDINRRYLHLRENGRTRESLKFNDFSDIVNNLEDSFELKKLSKWIKVVPFLPLEAAQLKLCTVVILQKLIENLNGHSLLPLNLTDLNQYILRLTLSEIQNLDQLSSSYSPLPPSSQLLNYSQIYNVTTSNHSILTPSIVSTSLSSTNLEQSEEWLKKLIEFVMSHHRFIPYKNPILAATGCKRIIPILKLILSEGFT